MSGIVGIVIGVGGGKTGVAFANPLLPLLHPILPALAQFAHVMDYHNQMRHFGNNAITPAVSLFQPRHGRAE